MLRGWIEIGMSNPNIFSNQSNPDVIFRTYGDSNDNQIIIGNTSSNDAPNRIGAMYVRGNNVGFKKVPLSNVDLDVNGIISTIDERIASNLTIGYGSLPGAVQLKGDLTVIGTSSASNAIISNSNQALSITYGDVDRLQITNNNAVFMNANVYSRNNIYSTGYFINGGISCNQIIASVEPARHTGYIFPDSTSNDLLFNTSNNTQRILFGFGSNVESTMYLSKSNLSVEKGTFYASNIRIGDFLPPDNNKLYVAGSTRITGDLYVDGTTTTINTDVQVTDQFTISNNDTGPALIVSQYGTQPIAEFKDDDINVLRIVDGGYVVIGSNMPTTKLDVEGDTTIRGSIFTSNIATSNIRTSNLIINNQLIIGSNGIITNSNFLPPLNTSNIVAGQFTSNFIRNDEIISSKLASNLILKGTTTFSSNIFVNNGDLRIYGSNNFLGLTDQARVYLGNDYNFIAGTKAGIVLQSSNSIYPFIIENNTGFVGLGVLDPEENLHIQSNAKIMQNLFVMQNVGIGKSNSINATLDVNSNIKSSVGTLGHCFTLIDQRSYADVGIGERLILNQTLEAGNPGNNTTQPLFYGNSYLYQDCSGENMIWKSARLLYRGCPLTNNYSESTFYIQSFINSRTPQYSNISELFTLSNENQQYGYVTYSTPWFNMSETEPRSISLLHVSNTDNASFRIGQTLIQFRA